MKTKPVKITAQLVETNTRHQRETFVAGRMLPILIAIVSGFDRALARAIESTLPFVEWHFTTGREGSKMQNSATIDRKSGRVQVFVDERQTLPTVTAVVFEYLSRAIVRGSLKAPEKGEDSVIMLPAKITGADDMRGKLHVSGKPTDPTLDSTSAEWLAVIVREAGVAFPPVSRAPSKRGSGTAWFNFEITNSAGQSQRINVKLSEARTWIHDLRRGVKFGVTFDADALAAAEKNANKVKPNAPTTGRSKPKPKPIPKVAVTMTGSTVDADNRKVA